MNILSIRDKRRPGQRPEILDYLPDSCFQGYNLDQKILRIHCQCLRTAASTLWMLFLNNEKVKCIQDLYSQF
jgi:hypothetical protein